METHLDENYFDPKYSFRAGDVVYNKVTDEKCVILRQLPIRQDDIGMSEKYYVRRPCGKKSCYYGVELSQKPVI